jgi:hypothetical protein
MMARTPRIIEAKTITWLVYDDRGGVIDEIQARNHADADELAENLWGRRYGKVTVASKPAVEQTRLELERRLDRDLPRHAYHEAGHVVFAHNFGPGVQRVALRVEMFSVGGRFDPYADSLARTEFKRWPREVNLDSPACRDQAEALMLTVLAGPMAEARFRGCRMVWRWFKGSDAAVVADLAPLHFRGSSAASRDAYVAYLRARAADGLDTYWHQVEAVAAALIERRQLSEGEIADIIRLAVPPTDSRTVTRS